MERGGGVRIRYKSVPFASEKRYKRTMSMVTVRLRAQKELTQMKMN